jgi:hypothetical protein
MLCIPRPSSSVSASAGAVAGTAGDAKEGIFDGYARSIHSQMALDEIAELLTQRPRKVLAFRKPSEFHREPLELDRQTRATPSKRCG